MAQLIADKKEIDFILYELLRVDELASHPQFSDF